MSFEEKVKSIIIAAVRYVFLKIIIDKTVF